MIVKCKRFYEKCIDKTDSGEFAPAGNRPGPEKDRSICAMLLPCGNFKKYAQDPFWVLDKRRSAAVRFFQMIGSRFPGPVPDRCGKTAVI